MAAVSQWTGSDTRRLRLALRLTVRAFAEVLGVSVRTVSKWEAGGRDRVPWPELQSALDTLLRRASEEERQRFTASTVLEPGQESQARSTDERPRSLQDAMTNAAVGAADFTVWWETHASGGSSAEVLLAEVRRLAGAYLDEKPLPVILELKRLQETAFALLRGHQSPSNGRDLHVAAGYLCVLLAWLSGDVGNLGAADTNARAAGLFADTSGSGELRSWCQAAQSKTAYWLGDYRAAADHAQAGLAMPGGASVRVLLAAQAADAWATVGSLPRARAALNQISAERERVTDEDEIGGLLACDNAREANYVSGVHQQLGDSSLAVAVATNCLSLSRSRRVRSYAIEAQVRLNLVATYLDLRDLDAVAEALMPVLALPEDRRLETVRSRLAQLLPRLASEAFADNHAAQELHDRISDFVEVDETAWEAK